MILVYIFIALGVVLLLFLAFVAMQPADFQIAREAVIPAPPETVFELVNDFHHWQAWSPWLGLDPAAKTTFDGQPSGTGAIFAWSGNKKIGAGRMTIVDRRPYDLIRIKLEFLKPWQATNTAEFTFRPQANQTHVKWVMIGKHSFISKAFCVFMNMDKMVGGDFEKGLRLLQIAAETACKS